MTLAYLNGAFVPEDEARVSAADHGVLFGRGLYETFRARNGGVFLLDRHVDRLRDGGRALGIDIPDEISCLDQIVRDLTDRCGITDARLRLTLTAGPAGGSQSLLVQARPNTDYPESLYERGMTAVVSDVRRNETSPLSRIKSLNLLDSMMTREEAARAGADTAILLNTRGNVAEASTANIFIVRDGQSLTPPISDGALPGVTRSFVLEEASETSLTLDDVLSADEAFLTGAVMGVMPLVRVGETPIGGENPAGVTSRVRARYDGAVGA